MTDYFEDCFEVKKSIECLRCGFTTDSVEAMSTHKKETGH
ncbi:MAG: hypothetical protein DDT31_01609 [Syntrophomonadaceae bacterium]|nr:hypothetical protein [Bacillota bacterium]